MASPSDVRKGSALSFQSGILSAYALRWGAAPKNKPTLGGAKPRGTPDDIAGRLL